MPLYEYACRECGHRFEVLQRVGEGGQAVSCPRCAASAPRRQLSTFAGQISAPRAAAARCSGGSGFG
jgi:putative FmdB family regulatory protein